MPVTISVRGLAKSFGGIVVADGIDLDLVGGRVLGLIGPNGAGKTSFFNLLTGVVKPDDGVITMGDRAIGSLNLYQRARLGLSRTWQNVRLFPSLTVLDNLMVGARDCAADSPIRLMLNPGAAKASEVQACQRAMKILADIGLDGVASQPAADLTYGQQKLVGVGRALMNEPRCLLLDEPMAGVEGQAYGTMQKVIRDLAAAGVAICVVEHNVAFIRDLCDEGVFMFAGKVLARGAVETLIADQQLTELYFGT